MAKKPPSDIKMAQKRISTLNIAFAEAGRDNPGFANPDQDEPAIGYVETPASRILDLCRQLQNHPDEFDPYFLQIKQSCMTLARAAPSFGPLILTLGYQLCRFDYAGAVERARLLLRFEREILEARGEAELDVVFERLASFGRYD